MFIFKPFIWVEHGIMRIGRVILWVLVWPVGLWRSIHHGKVVQAKRIGDEVAHAVRKEREREV